MLPGYLDSLHYNDDALPEAAYADENFARYSRAAMLEDRAIELEFEGREAEANRYHAEAVRLRKVAQDFERAAASIGK